MTPQLPTQEPWYKQRLPMHVRGQNVLEVKVKRTYLKDRTVGKLYINGKFQCFTLEDQRRDVKIKKVTCIPERTFRVDFRREGGHHSRYSKKFPDFHIGMLELQNVPSFKFILIHIGNYITDTDGCLLLGLSVDGNNNLVRSTDAYIKVYPQIAQALVAGNMVLITFEEEVSNYEEMIYA